MGGAILANTDVSSVVVNGQVMFVASRSDGQGVNSSVPGLFRSTDGGASFIQISGSGGLPTGSVTSLVTDPSDPNRLYAAVAAVQNSGIFRSDDLGKTWTNIAPPPNRDRGIGASTENIQLSVSRRQSPFMAVASPMGTTKVGNTAVVLQSVWQSLNQGATWQNIGGQGSGPGQGLPGTIENGCLCLDQ